MKLRLRFTAIVCFLCGIAMTVCACNGIPDQLKTVRLHGAEKTVTVPLDTADSGLVLSVDLQLTNGRSPIAVLPVPEGESPYAVITYPEDLEDYGFSALQEGNVFRLDTEQNRRFTTDDFSMTLYADVTAYELIGSLTLQADAGDVLTDTLKLDITGGAAVKIEGINTGTVMIDVEGAADVVLRGNAEKLEAEINGAGALEAVGLAAQNAVVTVNGVGAASIACAQALTAEINGAGSISYVGDPTLKKEINGLGSITRLPDEIT